MSQPDFNQTEEKKPKVSVCIASYNHARFIGETLDSILAQTYRDFEIVVVDDGSTDNSLEILNSYAEKYPQIRVFTHSNHENKGISVTANATIKKSRGEYISFIGSDDIWYPHFLEKQVDFLDKSDVGFVYSKADCIDKTGKLLNKQIALEVSSKADLTAFLLTTNPVSAVTTTVKRKALEEIGLFDEKLIYSDWDLWIRLSFTHKIGFIDESLGNYRIHGNNTSVGTDKLKIYRDKRQFYLRLIEKSYSDLPQLKEPKYQKIIAKELNWLKRQEVQLHLNSYFDSIAKKEYPKAKIALLKAFKLSPLTIFRPHQVGAILKRALLSRLK